MRPKSLGINLPSGVVPKPKGRARHKQGVMNAWEKRYADDVLEMRKRAGEILDYDFQPEKLLISRTVETDADGKTTVRSTYYEPDYRVVMADRSIEMHDVKGRRGGTFFIEDDAYVKIRVAAGRHPYLFQIAWMLKGGGWGSQVVEGRED